MKKYTQAEFDALPIVGGARQCPTGDYTGINDFGEECRFGEQCRFGEECSFGARCSFGVWCSFGARCSFGVWCRFGEECRFGARCRFGEECSFGARCSFGEECHFGEQCHFEGHPVKRGYPFMAIAGAGTEARTTHFFNHVDTIRVRSGCFFGTLSEFRSKVLIDTAGDKTHIKALQYLGMANIAAATFDPTQIEA
jgi:hypothetical protein